MLPDVTGSRFLKMAAAKPEVLLSQLPGTSGSILNSTIELMDPENGGLAVGTALMSCLEAEI